MRFSWLLLYVVFSSTGFSQRINPLSQDTLAMVGSVPITAKDFLERFELMPWPKKDVASRIELTKQEFLQSLVAEKLLAYEAAGMGIGSDSLSKDMQYNIERMFVRDELYKRSVTAKDEISFKEIQEGMKKYAYELELQVLGIVTKQDGELLYKKLTAAKNKDVSFKRYQDSLYIILDTIKLNFGASDIPIEDAAYALAAKEISKPVNSVAYGNWVMLRLLNKYTNKQYANLSKQDQLHKVKKIIEGRKEDSLATKAFASITSPHRAEADENIFFRTAESLWTWMKQDSLSFKTKNLYYFSPAKFSELEIALWNYLDSTFIIIESGNMTLKKVLEGLKNNYVVFPNLRKEIVFGIFNNNIKTVIQNELLAREGFKRNLQHSENVRHDVSTWMDNRKAHLVMYKILDTLTLSDEEIQHEYMKDPTLYGATVLVNLREILVDSIPPAISLRDRIRAGEDFAKLAKKYSKRTEWAKNGGESGFIDVSKWGELGLYAITARTDSLIGPLKIKEGMTIFKIIERKIENDSFKLDYQATRAKIVERLLPIKKQRTLNKYIGTLAKKYNVTMYNHKLVNTSTTTSSMFTWRHIGFGGRIMAAPTVSPQFGWTNEWQRQINLNQ